MADLNSYNATGRMGQDITLRDAGDSKVCNFSIAIQGIKKDETTWINCVAWKQQAEFLANHAKKGSHLRVSGRLQVRKHEDKVYTECVAYEVQILSGWKEEQQQQQQPQQNQQQGGGGYQEPPFNPDDDLPF